MSNHYLGMVNNSEIRIAENSVNKHLLIVGISGSGKSVRLTEIESQCCTLGETVIAIDINGIHYKVDSDNCQVISVLNDGIGVRVFDDSDILEKDGKVISNKSAYIADVLAIGQRFGVRQKSALREAIKYALEQKEKHVMDAMQEALLMAKTKHADSVLDVLDPIFEGNYLKTNNKLIQPGMLNIISFEGVSPSVQKTLIDILLSVLWKNKVLNKEEIEHVTVTIDECQQLNFGKDSILSKYLTESRKYKVSLILATQTLAKYDKQQLALLNQAATKLLFRPVKSDLVQVAKMIDFERQIYWRKILDNLKLGQAIAIGDLYVVGKKKNVTNPIITKSRFKSYKE